MTAKTKEAAQARVARLNKIKEWVWIKEENVATPTQLEAKAASPAKPVTPAKPQPVAKQPAAKVTKLDKLLYLQNGKCFFCGKVLAKAEASVEHLLPKSKGGTDADGNVVACCVTLNRTFGNMELRDKVRFVLEQKGDFRCPKA